MGDEIVSKNMHYAFNVEYLEYAIEHENTQADNYNQQLCELMNKKENADKILAFGREQVNNLSEIANSQRGYEVMYPGLLIGVGYPHITKKMTGEIQQGFSFDYVTGAPYYPGSSLKGVLRSVFHRANDKENPEEASQYREYLTDIIQEKTGKVIAIEGIQELELACFASEDRPLSERDQFFDSFVVGLRKENSLEDWDNKEEQKIVGLDNITPHSDILKNPIPITMLRIMPGVCLKFNMNLHDSKTEHIDITKEQKEEIFYQIIEDFGIGAKTNVGYGVLEYVKDADIEESVKEKTNNNVKVQNTSVQNTCKNKGCNNPVKSGTDRNGFPYKYCEACIRKHAQEQKKWKK